MTATPIDPLDPSIPLEVVEDWADAIGFLLTGWPSHFAHDFLCDGCFAEWAGTGDCDCYASYADFAKVQRENGRSRLIHGHVIGCLDGETGGMKCKRLRMNLHSESGH